MSQRQKLDRHLAGAPVITMLPQGLEQTFVSCTREELVAINEIEERHRLAPQGMDDVPVIHDMTALALGHRPTAPQRHDRRDAKEAFEPVVEDAHTQAMADQS